MSIDAAAYAFHEDPIARANILLSGTVGMGLPIVDPTFSNFTFVAQHFNCSSSTANSSVSSLTCMRDIPFSAIVNFIGTYTDSQSQPSLTFTPVLDDRLVFSDYEARYRDAKIARVPTILANTANEATSFAPFDPRNPSLHST